MRVISGRLSGRTFESVPGHRTHPMSEKMRGAIFNALGDIAGLTLLDAYAGTGAIAIEAISRGAASAVALDSDKKAARTIQENIAQLGLEEQIRSSLIHAHSWSRRNQAEQFDIVILDPPYDAVQPKELLQLAGHCKPGGVIVLSLPPSNGFQYAPSARQLLNHKNYGDAGLQFYRQLH
ncbi:MAG: RsmD family RNA methyltransferase [Candidatus Saccharimonadales bacterium]